MPHGLKRQQPMPSVVCGCCRQLCGFRHTLHQQPTPLHGNMSAEQQPAERTRSAQLWAEEEEREINSEWASQPSAAPAKQSPVRRHLKHDREPSAAVHPPCFGHGTNQQSAAASPRCLHLPAGLTQRCHRRTRPHRAGGMAGPAGSTAPVINTGAASAAGAVGSGSGDSLGLLAARRAFQGGPPGWASGTSAGGGQPGGGEAAVDIEPGSEEDRPREPTAIPTTERFPDSPAE